MLEDGAGEVMVGDAQAQGGRVFGVEGCGPGLTGGTDGQDKGYGSGPVLLHKLLPLVENLRFNPCFIDVGPEIIGICPHEN